MSIGKLEPLLRYLQQHNQTDAISAAINDMETLAKGGYIKSLGDGVHEIVPNGEADREVRRALESALGQDTKTYYTASYQAVDERMFININKVAECACRTILSMCINRNDTVSVFFVDGASLAEVAKLNSELYSATSTIAKTDSGEIRSGFVRSFTSIVQHEGSNRICIKCDFRLSRTTPFHICVLNSMIDPTAFIGVEAKAFYEEATCRG